MLTHHNHLEFDNDDYCMVMGYYELSLFLDPDWIEFYGSLSQDDILLFISTANAVLLANLEQNVN